MWETIFASEMKNKPTYNGIYLILCALYRMMFLFGRY
jgi:hypothetical protein